MIMYIKRIVAINICLFLICPGILHAVCKGTILNPVTDIYWPAMFPIKIGGITIVPGKDGLNVSSTSSNSPICVCPMPPPFFFRIGVPLSFRAPTGYIEVVKDSFCFPFFGTNMPVPSVVSGRAQGENLSCRDSNSSPGYTFYNAHYADFFPIRLLDILVDGLCLEAKSAELDITWLTEIDPLWQDDSISIFIHPESLLFANMIAQLACTVDSVAAQIGFPLDFLFWCFGSWGSAHPMTGTSLQSDNTAASAHIAARMLYRLARQGMLLNWSSYLCGPLPMPTLMKSHFKLQVAKPIAGRQSIPIGRSNIIWGIAKNPPTRMSDNFLYMIFVRRDCCVL